MGIHYDWTKIDGFQCPIKIVIAERGIGKTFPIVKRCVEKFVTKGKRFIYVVETGEMIKELSRNNGEKFWGALREYYAEQDTSRKRYMYNKLVETIVESEDEIDDFKLKHKTVLLGSTMKINGETAGYILDLNSFADIKRNNFVQVGTVVFDEFISENLDARALRNPYKMASLAESIMRLSTDIKIYMLGNSVRVDDPVLSRMGFKIKEFGLYKRYDKDGLAAVLDYVDVSIYKQYHDLHKRSVAGRFAALLGETNENENTFISDLPETQRLMNFKYKKNGNVMNLVYDTLQVTLRERDDGTYACVPYDSKGLKFYCLNQREVGYRGGISIVFIKGLRETIEGMIQSSQIYYYSEVEYRTLKLILKGGA